MQVKTFILPVLSSERSKDELNRFLRSHRVLQMERHFMLDDGLWAFLVCYMDGEQNTTSPAAHRSNMERFDPAKELKEEQQTR